MIGILKGKIHSRKPTQIIVMVGGVGYIVSLPSTLLEKTRIDESITLHTYTHVRKDMLDLFGFATEAELRLFELVNNISGIGPKKALTIVDRGVSAVRSAVVAGDVAFFTSIPRMGKKNAQKIIIDIRSKMGQPDALDLSQADDQTKEVAEALVALGYSRSEIARALSKIPASAQSVSDKIKHVLKTNHKK